MLTESGKVLAVESNGVWVETLKTSTCAQCRAKNACGQRLLASSDAYTRVHVDLPAEFANLQPGDEVLLGIDESAFVSGVLISYGIPLSAMLLAVLGVSRVSDTELFLVVAALSGLLFGGLIVRLFARTLTANNCYKARLLSRANNLQARPVNLH
ncbi:RseC/MucC-like positive regulator of sigma(E) [Alteromonadaceae bacterium 2753L.S.0a.02]|nr:RseC/MucC-like positive regulator of sigma(E) [Alteromonadaceae bacterium 2753L.S.0a.02]